MEQLILLILSGATAAVHPTATNAAYPSGSDHADHMVTDTAYPSRVPDADHGATDAASTQCYSWSN